MPPLIDEGLRKKLGIRPDTAVALVAPPDGFAARIGVVAPLGLDSHPEVVVAFFEERACLEALSDRLVASVYPAGALYFAWLKRSSGEETDLSDTVVRHVLTERGVVDTKVCSLDERWSALKFIWRLEHRHGPLPPLGPRKTPAQT